MADQEAVAARNRAVLEAFVVRSRRVDAHSLMRDPDRVMALARGEMKLQFIPETGETFLALDLPSEEVIESAAARARPLLLNEDPVYWAKAMKALSYFLRNNFDAEIKESLAEIKARWQARVATKPGEARAYFVQLNRGNGSPTSTIVDSDLGMAWFYGDVVHADAVRREIGADYGINERYRAAVLLISNVLVCNRMTLGFIRDLQGKGVLDLADDALAEEVVVTQTKTRKAAKIYLGERGTAMPDDITGDILDGFEEFDPAKHAKGVRMVRKAGP